MREELTSDLRVVALLRSTFSKEARSPTLDSNSTNFSQISLHRIIMYWCVSAQL